MAAILHRYLLKELGRAFVLAFVCFELFMFLGLSIQLLHKGLDIINLRPLIPYILLYACPYSLPASLLTATVVTYGRLCADNEIAAIRTCGIHLRTIIMPIIFVGIILCIVTLYLNAKVLPRAFYWVQVLQEQALKQILSGHNFHMQKKLVLEPYHIYIRDVEGPIYKHLVVIEFTEDYVTNVLIAEEGTINVNEPENIVVLRLRNGEFYKPNYRNPEDIPKSGNFIETSFEIPIEFKISETTRKFLTLPQLFALRQKINRELGDPEKLFKNPWEVERNTVKEMLSLDSKLKLLLEEQEVTIAKIQDANESVTNRTKKMETLKEEIKLSEQHSKMAKANLELLMQELNTKKEEQHFDSIRLFNDDIIIEEEDDETEKIARIKERISRAQNMIQNTRHYIQELGELQEQEKNTLENATATLNALNREELELRTIRTDLAAQLEQAKKQVLQHETSITIHKRLSPSLSCLVFVLIGIPLGIKTRCGNILISLGISFLLVLVLYYPLVIAGWVLAGDRVLPVVPAVWGANIIVGVVALLFFQQVLRR